MKSILFNRSLPLILMLAFAGSSVFAQTTGNETPLTNAAVVKLVKAGFREKTIITIIAARPSNFELTPERMIDLKKSGVSEKVILAMIYRQQGADFSDDTWSDEEFFNASTASPEKMSGNTPATGGTTGNPGSSIDIFGSSGGSKGSTKTRAGSGGSSGDIMTTGTATVRILRPPTEAGGATKLERTPSLTNDSIIELIEAGFSEGTIIRRIEQSPVAFQFSDEKIAELRKHRVSEKVLAAMKAAMGMENEEPKKQDPKPTSSNVTPKQ